MSNQISSGVNYQTAWSKALERLSQLTPAQQKMFDYLKPGEKALFEATVNPSEVLALLKELEDSRPSLKRIIKFNQAVMKPFAQFQSTIEAVVNASSGLGGPVWAPIKIILQIVMSAAGEFEKISGFLQDTLEQLTLFAKYEKHFQSSNLDALELVRDALALFYFDVVDLALVVAKHFRTNFIRYTFRRVVKTFDSDFEEILSSMKRHVQTISPAVALGGIMEARSHNETVSTQLNQLQISADNNAEQILNERYSAARDWLFCTNPELQQKKNQEKHLENSCHWFFETPELRAWSVSQTSSRICVQGIPGSGKSILSSVVINHLILKAPQEESIIYFFCKENDEERNNPLSVLRTFVFQLLKHPVHKPKLIPVVHKVYDRSGTPSADSTHDLWALLREILDMLPSPVYCIIDGLDECDNKDDEMTKFLTELTKCSKSSSTVLKVFTTSRLNESYMTETSLKEDWSLFVIEEENVKRDINAFISKRIEESAILRDDRRRQKVHSRALQGAGGMILWAKLMLDEISAAEPWEVDNILEMMPNQLSDVYGLMFKRRMSSLKGKPFEKCRRVLHWITIARRPLLVDELLLALSVAAGLKSHEDYSPEFNAESRMLLQKACGSLVVILEDDSVQLVHTSLRQYLLNGDFDTLSPPNPKSPESSEIFNQMQMHKDLAKACLLYNQFTCFQKSPYSKSFNKSLYPFLAYSTCNWIYHTTNSKPNDDDLLDETTRFFSSKQSWRWIERCEDYNITNGHLLLMQAELGGWVKSGPPNPRVDVNIMGNFILYLSRQQCNDFQLSDTETEPLNAICRVADLYREYAQYNEALEWYERALAGYRKAGFGEEHPSTLAIVNNIALVYQNQGRYAEALEWFERTLAGCRKALGEEHPSALGTVHNIAYVYQNQGRYAEALEWYERALAGRRKALGEEHPSTLDTVYNIAIAYHNRGRYEEALEWYERALAGRRKALGEEHPSTLRTVNNIAIAKRELQSALRGWRHVHTHKPSHIAV